MKKLAILVLTLAAFLPSQAHDIDYGKVILRQWHFAGNTQSVEGSFSHTINGQVYIEDASGNLRHFPLNTLSPADRSYVLARYDGLVRLNRMSNETQAGSPISTRALAGFLVLALFLLFGVILFLRSPVLRPYRLLAPVFATGLLTLLFGFRDKDILNRLSSITNPTFVDSAFTPFKPKVYTHWDDTYFYVESKGIPDHQMMVGITSWQQQVPIPQCYTTANNNNHWSIPLNPVIAAVPVPVNQQHFLRGAIAVAVNGVAIFNPYTNTGIDAFLDGQLDQWGGHCGRADDYHYHIAPLHLYGQTAATKPIAFALDGFAVYGATEPEGTPMATLDANHGHFGANGTYHYHGTATAPYMVGNMVGQVTEDNTLQIIPQAAARSVRPFLPPLSGAAITNFQPNGQGNGYNLTYTRNGGTYQVNYFWNDTLGGSNSRYTFRFISPTSTADSIYLGFSQSQCTVPTGPLSTVYLRRMKRLPDTGETTDFTPTPGEDGDVIINAPYYVNNNDGTITDTVTGLMWQKKDGGEMTYENAVIYCDTLTLGGYSNWRLPDAHESFSILYHQNANPAIDTNSFTATTADYWWTSDKQANDVNKIWCTNSGGGVGNKPKTETISAGGSFRYHVRAVRDVNLPDTFSAHFVKLTGNLVKDNFTGLLWQAIPYTDTLSWENALRYADTLTLGGYSDWRLPNIKEIRSLNNEKQINPSFDTTFFKIVNNKKYWSSTTLPNHSNEGWYLNTRYGITSYDLKTVRNYVMCVRGNLSTLITYVFNGNGSWDNPDNWFNRSVPPALLPSGNAIVVDPVQGGQCVLNITQQIAPGARITVNTGKSFVVPGQLIIR